MRKTPPGAFAPLHSLLHHPLLRRPLAVPTVHSRKRGDLAMALVVTGLFACQSSPPPAETPLAPPPVPTAITPTEVPVRELPIREPVADVPAKVEETPVAAIELPAEELLPEADRPASVIEREIMSVLEGEAPLLSASQREDVKDALLHARESHGVEPLLVLALIQQESRFKPRAVGPAGSLGLMQLRRFVAEDVAKRNGLPFEGRTTLFDPGANVRLGTLFLAELIERFGDTRTALAAYNAGPTRVARMIARGSSPPNGFVNRVRSHYDTLHQFYGVAATSWGG